MTTPRLTEVFLLREAACPSCGSKGAYVGFHDVECDNPSCRHYKESEKGHPDDPEIQDALWTLMYGAASGEHSFPPGVQNIDALQIYDAGMRDDNGTQGFDQKSLKPGQLEKLRKFVEHFLKQEGELKDLGNHRPKVEKALKRWLGRK